VAGVAPRPPALEDGVLVLPLLEEGRHDAALSFRDWYESGKSTSPDRCLEIRYLSTPVSPVHAEPLQTGSVLPQGLRTTFPCVFEGFSRQLIGESKKILA